MLCTNESQLLIWFFELSKKYLFPVLSKLLTLDKDQHIAETKQSVSQDKDGAVMLTNDYSFVNLHSTLQHFGPKGSSSGKYTQ